MSSRRFPLVVAVAASLAGLGPGQNSVHEDRPEPSPTAARAGSAVQWRRDLDAALAESAESGAPVFWYVPTLRDSPMDRKAELDRYMMAGPFSDPDVVALLNAGFVPVRAVPDADAAREHDLRRGEFIEPGFLVLGRDGAELRRAQRIDTLHASWFLAALRPVAARQPAARALPAELAEARRAYAAGDDARARAALAKIDPGALAPELAAEAGFFGGAVEHRSGRADLAEVTWKRVAERFPDTLFGWKAAAEAEGHGPFARGFEDFLDVAPRALAGALTTSRAAEGAYRESDVRALSLRFLVRMQQPGGAYTDSRYDFGGTDSLPNVYTAVTAIVGLALLEELAQEPCAFDRRALERSLAGVWGHVRGPAAEAADDTDEIVWAHVYGTLLCARWCELRPQDEVRVRPELERVVRRLQQLGADDGAWFHEYANPFATAAALLALHRARELGVEVDAARASAGRKALLRCRARSGAFTYGQVRGGAEPRASVPAAAGRMPLCELALLRWEQATPESLAAAVRAGFQHHDQLESVRAYDDHANALGYGGFFFWFDMVGRALAIRALPAGEERAELAAQQRALVLAIPEVDGCFLDSHELGRVYGTASALWCLALLRGLD